MLKKREKHQGKQEDHPEGRGDKNGESLSGQILSMDSISSQSNYFLFSKEVGLEKISFSADYL